MNKTPWTDATIMPWGRHRGTVLEEVPADYLLWYFEQPWAKEWAGLYAYCLENQSTLLEQVGDEDPNNFNHRDMETWEDYQKDKHHR